MENKNIPTYQILINENTTDESGVFKVSFVDQPAIESNFVYLSTEKKPIELTGEPLKQLVTGAVLIPDKPIYRKDSNGYERNILFTKDGIFKIVKKFFKQKLTDQTNLQHLIPVDDNYVIESWIVSDSNNDKSVSLGLDQLPVGTWVMTYHVPDPQVFSKIVSGELKGFSIEGLFNDVLLPNQNLKTNKNQKPMKKGLLNKVFNFFKSIELTDYKTKDGKTLTVDETTMIASIDGVAVKGDFELEDGTVIVVNDESITTDIKAPVMESTEENVVVESQVAVEASTDKSKESVLSPDDLELINSYEKEQNTVGKGTVTIHTVEINEDQKKLFDELNKIISDLTTENSSLKSEVEKLSKLPAANVIDTTPIIKVELEKMTTAERITYNIEQLSKQGLI